MNLVDTEQQTAQLCGAPTGDDALLLEARAGSSGGAASND